MKNLKTFAGTLKILFTDIDDTMTDDGFLDPAAYDAMWKLAQSGIQVVPVTGRPAGWCEMIARQWPVAGVIGENGGFYFRRVKSKKGLTSIKRHYIIKGEQQLQNRKKLDAIAEEVLKKVPGSAIASDQFSRLMDLAIDFCEDVKPLKKEEVQKIANLFKTQGAQAKISSIHVNGWYGTYNKLSTTKIFLKKEFQISPAQSKIDCGFIGDSPNDEPMFAHFPKSFGVANIKTFQNQMKNLPTYISKNPGGQGFAEIAKTLIKNK